MVTYLSPSHTPICTRIHIYTGCFTDSPPSYTYIYIHICSVSPHRVKYLFYRTDSPPSCIHKYTYILCFTTQLTSVLPHRWPSFTTLGKPTIWMVTYLSPPYTPTCTHIHTNMLFVLQITHHHIYIYIYTMFHHTELSICFTAQLAHHHAYIYIYIYIHIYSVSPHRVNICFTAQMAQFYHTGETNNLDGDVSITILYTHMYTHTYCLFYR